ncbi:fucose 4-O-acetylase-like acetyltransferase [Cytobacillus eiseniae]|uniref:Fucose 4-O-acetylase-like acetyltransferase n=1 Tax=Cytobacillus eiseniae TaxID=762947 RepID=A0ABS4RAI8_9BACI|nr:acyltransferase family protein [Cytobacillus eiseniae]MBP2239908.1 fucose 4-O-acetylase-like acetyltransferase [Cytobacillus eiseniae]
MKQRDFYFDNAKFILIFLVVFGHFLRSYITESETIFTLYKVIYTFHMPAFILVSGYFAKGYHKKGYLPKIAKKLILPYIIFQLIYSIFYYFLFDKSNFQMDPLTPHWSLWFLISLFFWNMLLLIFAKMKPTYSIATALIIGLAIGYIEGFSSYLSISRTFVFFPLFLIGYYMKKEQFRSLLKPHIKGVAITIFILAFTGFYYFPDINYEWLLGSKPYAEMGAATITALFTRLGFYILSLAIVLSFFSLMPKRQYFFTSLGKNTFYVYLLHGFFVRIFRESAVQDYFTTPENFLLLAGVSLLLTFLLSSKLITSLTQPIIELNTSKIKSLKIKVRSLLHFYRRKLMN